WREPRLLAQHVQVEGDALGPHAELTQQRLHNIHRTIGVAQHAGPRDQGSQEVNLLGPATVDGFEDARSMVFQPAGRRTPSLPSPQGGGSLRSVLGLTPVGRFWGTVR